MTQFFEDASINPMLMRGIYAGLLAAVACGVIGPYVVTRRFVFLAGAIAHTAVGGIGFAIWLRHQAPDSFEWFTPLHGATLAALLGALVVGMCRIGRASVWTR